MSEGLEGADEYQRGYDAGYADGENEGRREGAVQGLLDADMFNGYLEAMKRDQLELFGVDIDAMTVEERRAAVVVHAWSAVDELSELMRELQWKPWKTANGLLVPDSSPEIVAGEMADVLHFVAHICNICGVDDDVLNEAMYAARNKNYDRMNGTYAYEGEKEEDG